MTGVKTQKLRIMFVILSLCSSIIVYVVFKKTLIEKNIYSFRNLVNEEFTCLDLDQLHIHKLVRVAGNRNVFTGTYRGVNVAVKTITPKTSVNVDKQRHIAGCIRLINDLQDFHVEKLLKTIKSKCASRRHKFMIYEIIYYSAFKNDNIVKHFGYCMLESEQLRIKLHQVQFTGLDENAHEMFLNSSIISILELGSLLSEEETVATPLPERLRLARELAVMVDAMNNTLFGPMQMNDFSEKHIASIDGKWKMFDMCRYLPADATLATTTNIEKFCNRVLNIAFKNEWFFNNETCCKMTATEYIDFMESKRNLQLS